MSPTSSKKPAQGKRVQQLKIEAAMFSKVEVVDSSRDIFPFLDLSAELRNQIYELSLHHDRKNGITAHVALLRVNKQICKEAQQYLFDHGTFFFEVYEGYVTPHLPYSLLSDILLVEGDMAYKIEDRSIGTQFGCHHIWPNALRRLRRIHILMHGDGERTAELFRTLVKYLRSYDNKIENVAVEIADQLQLDCFTGAFAFDDKLESARLFELPASISLQFLTKDRAYLHQFTDARAEWLDYLDDARQGRLRLPSKD